MGWAVAANAFDIKFPPMVMADMKVIVRQNSRLVLCIGISYVCCFIVHFNDWYKKSMGKPVLSAPARTVRDGNLDRFMESLFVPAHAREPLLVLYAFETELAHVHHRVTEEVNGHIRYAWWQESLDMIHAGQAPRAHPLIQALAPLMRQGLLHYEALSSMVALYRSVFPQLPKDMSIAEAEALRLIQKTSPEAEEGWNKAHIIISAHRAKHGPKKNMVLYLKLIWLGLT